MKFFKREKFESIEWIDEWDAIITTNKRKYRGSSSVWHSYPDGKRANTFKESWLLDLFQREQWRLKDESRSK